MEKILQRNCHSLYIEDMARYSIVNNLKRSIPEIKDGLKPVQRRIIYCMAKDERAIGSHTVKSTAVIGTILKKYHPHGDTSVYDAMKPLSNWFERKIPLLIPGGNFGNIGGDGASAPRYTFATLSPFAVECVMGGLQDSSAMADWLPNFDDTCKEPKYLPCKVPLLLINGADGIGVGLSTSIPPHALIDVLDATIALIDNPTIDIVLIPDHCIPCDIIDTDWKDISMKGSGSYRARGHIYTTHGKVIEDPKKRGEIHIVENENEGNPLLIVKSLPEYNTNKITSQIEALVAGGKFPQILDINDASDTDNVGVCIIVKLRKGADTEFVKSALYKFTDIEKSFSVNFEAVDDIASVRMNYKSYLESFIQFTMNNKFRELYNRLEVINTRYHKIDAFIKVIKSGYIDEFINMIKKKKGTDEASLVEFLIKHAKVTDLQASFILNASIKSLSYDSLARYEEEAKKIIDELNYIEPIITDDNKIKELVKEELIYIRNKYGTPRVCKIIQSSDTGNIPKGNFKIVVTENNYIRKLSPDDVINIVKGDKPKYVIDLVDNTENIILFDNKGRVYLLPIHKVPLCGKSDGGIDIRLSIRGLTADIVNIMYETWIKKAAKNANKYFVLVLTKNHYVKKLDIEDFLKVPPSGIIYSKLNGDDNVVSVQIVSDQLDLVVYSNHKALRVPMTDIPCYKRNSIGVGIMNTIDDIHGCSIIYPETTDIIVVTQSGKVNKFPATGLEVSNRGRAGNSVIKLGRNDEIFNVYGVVPTSILNINTSSGMINIPVADIPVGSSISSGEKMVSTKSDVILNTSITY
nr:MAG TPA: DNA topoisomerase 2 alpha [Caudoviricetes sp.]